MIRSFKNTDTETVWNREYLRSLGPELQRAAQKRLRLPWSDTGPTDVEITDYH